MLTTVMNYKYRKTLRDLSALCILFMCGWIYFHYNDSSKRLDNNDVRLFFKTESTVKSGKSDTSDEVKILIESPLNVIKHNLPSETFVYVCFVDLSYKGMALNFYETSISRHNIKNIVFVSQSRSLCDQLVEEGLLCALFDEVPDEDKIIKDDQNIRENKFTEIILEKQAPETPYGSRAFRSKMDKRAEMLLKLLESNITILLTDVDIIFLNDPKSELLKQCSNQDICALWETDSLFNAGFMLVAPTNASQEMIRKRLELTNTASPPTDQDALNHAARLVANVKIHTLSKSQFVQGAAYFEYPKRYFYDTAPACPECIVIHNNWIVSKSAKIYRFRENMMWMYDGDDYYSSLDNRFITYDNPIVEDGSKQLLLEEEALINALAIGRTLNRIVILPKFHCSETSSELCPLNSHFLISHLNRHFEDMWKEHVFLDHPKVSEKIIKSITEVHLIENDKVKNLGLNVSSDVVRHPSDDVTDYDIADWFSSDMYVLRFHSLYHAFDRFGLELEEHDFNEDIKKSLHRDGYRQYNN